MRKLLLALAVVAVVVVGWLVARPRGERPREVETAKVETRERFDSWVTASGEIVASRYADLSSSVMGRIVDLAVAEGEPVTAGQVLARIDPVAAQSEEGAATARLEASEAELAAARAGEVEAGKALERARSLDLEGVISRSDLDAAQAAWDTARAQREAAAKRVGQARAELRQADDRLEKTEIKAPMDGVVTRLAVREGEMVVIGIQNQPGTVLMTLSDLSSINAEVQVAEADVLRLKVGQPGRVTLEALPERELDGRVVEIGASALPQTAGGAAAREFKVVLRLENPDPRLRPGLTCDVRILADQALGVVVAPLQAVVLRAVGGEEEVAGLFVVEQGRARFRPITTGIIGGLDMVVDGVPPGTEVVIGPFQVLRDLADGQLVSAG